ncbi:MAG TPA: hypothetical protein VHE35_02440 [Kofleriaceae bacterium]|nr:hypothetical protein [Kofleriaceae bacterium]
MSRPDRPWHSTAHTPVILGETSGQLVFAGGAVLDRKRVMELRDQLNAWILDPRLGPDGMSTPVALYLQDCREAERREANEEAALPAVRWQGAARRLRDEIGHYTGGDRVDALRELADDCDRRAAEAQ